MYNNERREWRQPICSDGDSPRTGSGIYGAVHSPRLVMSVVAAATAAATSILHAAKLPRSPSTANNAIGTLGADSNASIGPEKIDGLLRRNEPAVALDERRPRAGVRSRDRILESSHESEGLDEAVHM